MSSATMRKDVAAVRAPPVMFARNWPVLTVVRLLWTAKVFSASIVMLDLACEEMLSTLIANEPFTAMPKDAALMSVCPRDRMFDTPALILKFSAACEIDEASTDSPFSASMLTSPAPTAYVWPTWCVVFPV